MQVGIRVCSCARVVGEKCPYVVTLYKSVLVCGN